MSGETPSPSVVDREIEAAVRERLGQDLLTGARIEQVDDRTPLLSGGLLDSISTMVLVSFLEERYGIELAAHEISVDHFDTIESIAALVREKLGVAP